MYFLLFVFFGGTVLTISILFHAFSNDFHMERGEVTIYNEGTPFERVGDVLPDGKPVVIILIYWNLNFNGVHLVLGMLKDVKRERALLDFEFDDVLDFPSGLQRTLLEIKVMHLGVERIYPVTKGTYLVLKLLLLDGKRFALLLEHFLVLAGVARDGHDCD